ncbi:MAG: hypothetical protein FD153_24 [Rhodospirillaceae bacterium]|nr:MAG: hypothetical protein FD153_24 [Rhodospirillaceae bacterium]
MNALPNILINRLTPGHKRSIVMSGASDEAPGFDSPDSTGAHTAPFRVRFFYDRRTGDTRNGVPASSTRVCQPLCVCRQILDRISGRQGSKYWSMP